MRFELMTMTLALKKKALQAQMLVQIPCRTHGVSDRGPYLGSAWFVGNETLSVVQQGLNDDLNDADGEQCHKCSNSDFCTSIRIEFVEVFHDFSPVLFWGCLNCDYVLPWTVNIWIDMRTCSYTM